jgi:PTH1 family peptidyl-tRNA hydrolase
MILISGLGNPGGEFENTRHNIGFEIIDTIRENFGFPKYQKKFKGQISKKVISDKTVILFKPQNFMNLSGEPIRKVSDFHKVENQKNLFIFHDDLDIDFPKIRIKENGGHGGHNGIKNIITFIGNDFHRIKFGIKNNLLIEKKIEPKDFVLNKFSNKERKIINDLKNKIKDNLNYLLDKNFSLFVKNLSI